MRSHAIPERSMMLYWTVGISIFLVALVFALLYRFGLSQPVSSTTSNVPEVRQDSAQISQDRPLLLTLPDGHATLYVPCCTFGVGGTISMVSAEANIFNDVSGQSYWSRPDVVNVEYYDSDGLLVENATTSTPVKICFHLNDEQWAGYHATPADYQIQYFNDQRFATQWRSADFTANPEDQTLCANRNELALFALAKRQAAAEIPVTGPDGPYQP